MQDSGVQDSGVSYLSQLSLCLSVSSQFLSIRSFLPSFFSFSVTLSRALSLCLCLSQCLSLFLFLRLCLSLSLITPTYVHILFIIT